MRGDAAILGRSRRLCRAWNRQRIQYSAALANSWSFPKDKSSFRGLLLTGNRLLPDFENLGNQSCTSLPATSC